MSGAFEESVFACVFSGHFTVGPTGESMTCLRCGKTLDGLGLDPALATTHPTTQGDQT